MAVAATLHWQNGFFLDWAGNQKGEATVYRLLAIGVALVVVIRSGGKWVIAEKAEQNDAPHVVLARVTSA
jgi:putative oxidoreductase